MVLVYGHKSRLKLQDHPNTGQFNFTNNLMKLCFILFLADPEYFQVGYCQTNQILLSSFSAEHGRKATVDNKHTVGPKRTWLEITSGFLFSRFLTLLSFFQPAFYSSEDDALLIRGIISVSLLGVSVSSVAEDRSQSPVYVKNHLAISLHLSHF